MAKIAVIGIGNVLAGDDAVGPHVVRVLEAHYELPDGVQVIDAGTPGSCGDIAWIGAFASSSGPS